MKTSCRICGTKLTSENWSKCYRNPTKPENRQYLCKSCDAQKSKRYYEQHRQQILRKQVGKPQNNEYGRRYNRKHRDEIREYSRKYHHKNREKCLQKHQEWEARNKHKIHCKNLAQNVPLGSHCEMCGGTHFRLERHHPDYNKPLEIVTLCHSCHTRLHNSTSPLGDMLCVSKF